MAVGNQPTRQQLDDTLSACSAGYRDIGTQILNMQQQVTSLGLAGLVTAGYSNTANPANPGGVSDAQLCLNMWNYLATNAQIFIGTATQASLFNFSNALAGTYGGR